MNPPQTQLKNQRIHRLINSRHPTVSVFDRYADNEKEARIAFELEESTNPRLIDRLHALPEGSLLLAVDGAGATLGNAAFIHCDDNGGRFNDGRLGAWYASFEVESAIAESAYHNERRLLASESGFPNRIQVRELIARVTLNAVDICRKEDGKNYDDLYHLTDYGPSQAFANAIRWPYQNSGEDAIRYDSVRREGGTNICIFRPQAVGLPIVQGAHYQYEWDAGGAVTISELRQVSPR